MTQAPYRSWRSWRLWRSRFFRPLPGLHEIREAPFPWLAVRRVSRLHHGPQSGSPIGPFCDSAFEMWVMRSPASGDGATSRVTPFRVREQNEASSRCDILGTHALRRSRRKARSSSAPSERRGRKNTLSTGFRPWIYSRPSSSRTALRATGENATELSRTVA